MRAALCVQADHPSLNGSGLPALKMSFRVCSESKVGAKFQEVMNAWNGSVVVFLTPSANAFPVKYRLQKKKKKGIGAKTG